MDFFTPLLNVGAQWLLNKSDNASTKGDNSNSGSDNNGLNEKDKILAGKGMELIPDSKGAEKAEENASSMTKDLTLKTVETLHLVATKKASDDSDDNGPRTAKANERYS